jgi:hypothetical protein
MELQQLLFYFLKQLPFELLAVNSIPHLEHLFPVTSGCIGQNTIVMYFQLLPFTDSSCLFFDYSLLLQLPSALLKELFFSFY